MRVTRETRIQTRRRLLDAARHEFGAASFASATTRDIARRAGVAAGTLFNYFPGKEALGAALLVEASEAAEAEFDATRRAGEPLEETLFAWVAILLRHLSPFRSWAPEVLEAGSGLLPSPGSATAAEGERFRTLHLERVQTWLAEQGRTRELPIDLHLYWTLFLGVVGFWSADTSRNQEATLALLDRSMGLFARGLTEDRRS
jgi:AcrR family transcriptional regulator